MFVTPQLLAWMYITCLPSRAQRGIKGGACVGTTEERKLPPPSPPRKREGKPRGSANTWKIIFILYSSHRRKLYPGIQGHG